MPRQKPTNPDVPDWSLTPQQETAVVLLVSGKTLTDTAMAIAVTRQTVSAWVNQHPGFQAALHNRRQELWDGLANTLRGLLPRAVEVLKQQLESEQPLPAAVHVLKACGLYGGIPAPGGWVEVEDAVAPLQRRRQDQAMERFAAHFTAQGLVPPC
jgi:hypothetical protein